MSSTQATSQAVTFSAPASIIQAVDFLTRPLLTIYSPAKVFCLRLLLHTSLSVLFSQRKAASPRLTITLAPGPVAPRALYPSSMEAGIRWADWIMALGGNEFDLIIEEESVAVCILGQKQTLIWSDKSSTSSVADVAALANPARSTTRASLRSMVDSAMKRAETRTVAQQLLTSEHEEKEAEELFACLAQTRIISPTPTRAVFALTTSAMCNTPEISSRPSSRSSEASSSGFSTVSDVSLATSVSSSYSVNLKPEVYKPPFVRKDASQTSTHKSTPSSSSITMTKSVNEDAESASVWVDQEKKEVTKYLYQGGVSTVLTGGVMLGAPSSAKKTSSSVKSSTSWRRRD